MKMPKGKGFDLVSGLIITVVLDSSVSLTGTFLGDIQEKCRHRKYDELQEFILIQLTCPVYEKDEVKIPKGTFCAINVDKIQFIFPGIKYKDEYDDNEWQEKYDDDKYQEKCEKKYYNKCDEKCHDKCHEKCGDEKDHNKWDNSKW